MYDKIALIVGRFVLTMIGVDLGFRVYDVTKKKVAAAMVGRRRVTWEGRWYNGKQWVKDKFKGRR